MQAVNRRSITRGNTNTFRTSSSRTKSLSDNQKNPENTFRKRSWLLLACSLALLVILIAAFGLLSIRAARSIHTDITEAHDSYLRTDKFLRAIPTDMYVGGLLVRDYLLDDSETSEDMYEQQLAAIRLSIEERLGKLEPELGQVASPAMHRLRVEVQGFWESLEPIFKWTPQQKRALGRKFLYVNVLPRWQNVVDLAEEINGLNEANLRAERDRIEASQNRFQTFVRNILALALGLGLVIAIGTTRQFRVLEARNESHTTRIAQAEQELRRLSRSLVQAQEVERKFISRELHDALGQMLTAQGMELSSLESMRDDPARFNALLKDVRTLNKELLASVRDLAMGLRPSMLDDIGLLPALEWHARQFSRRVKIPVTVDAVGDLRELPESHLTCIYRAVQEALTNCARHSEANRIAIEIATVNDEVLVTVKDDGKGFDVAKSTRSGLGLLGIQERVQELNGLLSIRSTVGKGTTLSLKLPLGNKPA
jgi:signal transduction histidine kinase